MSDLVVGEPVEIRWIDSCMGGGEYNTDEVPGPLLCISVGLLVSKSDEDVRIAMDLFDNGHYRSTLALPKCCIKHIRRLVFARAALEANDE